VAIYILVINAYNLAKIPNEGFLFMGEPTDTSSTPPIVIEGITLDGRIFRPSNWAERVSGLLSTFVGQRMHYSPLLKPSTRNGTACVLLDPSLEECHPHLYQYLLEFAKHNQLRIFDKKDD
jgi:hypothetical protein